MCPKWLAYVVQTKVPRTVLRTIVEKSSKNFLFLEQKKIIFLFVNKEKINSFLIN